MYDLNIRTGHVWLVRANGLLYTEEQIIDRIKELMMGTSQWTLYFGYNPQTDIQMTSMKSYHAGVMRLFTMGHFDLRGEPCWVTAFIRGAALMNNSVVHPYETEARYDDPPFRPTGEWGFHLDNGKRMISFADEEDLLRYVMA